MIGTGWVTVSGASHSTYIAPRFVCPTGVSMRSSTPTQKNPRREAITSPCSCGAAMRYLSSSRG